MELELVAVLQTLRSVGRMGMDHSLFCLPTWKEIDARKEEIGENLVFKKYNCSQPM